MSETATPFPTPPPASPARPAGAKPPLWRNPFFLGFLLGAVVLSVLPFIQRLSLRAPPPITSLGAWELVDETGKPFGSKDLKDTVWIASFFFARCPSVCPKQQEDFRSILRHVEDLGADVHGRRPIRLVSFTVDPEDDTPEALAAYARKMDAPAGRWTFLTGDKDKIAELLIKRMLVDMGEKQPLQGSEDLFDISHANKFVLIDQNGDVRGYWNTDELARGNLINAARLLWKKGPRP